VVAEFPLALAGQARPWPARDLRHGRRGARYRGQRIAADYFTAHHGAAKRAGLPRLHKGEAATPEQLQAAAATLVFVVVTPDGSK